MEHVGWVERSLADSEFTKPEYDAVTAGIESPYVTDGEDAVIVNGAGSTVKD